MSLLLNTVRLGVKTTSTMSPKLGAKLAIEMLFRPGNSGRKIKYFDFWKMGSPVTFNSGCTGRIFGNGEKVVFIVHGWRSQGARFKKIIQKLLTSNYTVVAWDGPGHGESPRKRTHLAEFSKDLLLDINSFSRPVETVIGHSFGGAACAYICSLGAPVKNLILLAAPSDTFGVFERYWNFISLGEKSRSLFLKFAEHECQVTTDELSSQYFVKDLPQKILAIHCKDDRLVPYQDSEALAPLNKNTELMITEGLGHHKLLDNEKVIETIFKFLN